MSTDLQQVTFDDLRNGDKWRFIWGFMWRGLVTTIASAVGGGLAGAVIGFVVTLVAQLAGKTLADVLPLIRILGGTAGALVGLMVLWQFVRWLFRASWFGYRLRLIRDAI